MFMEEGKLIEIRCPGQTFNANKNELIPCNKLCCKVYPGSSGECQCRACKLKFRFYVDSQANSIMSVKTKAMPKSIDNDKNT